MTTSATMHDLPSRAERLLVTVVAAPLGLGAKVVDELPAGLARARRQVALARFIGKLAVDQGAAELRRRVSPSTPTASGTENGTKSGAASGTATGDAVPRAASAVVGTVDRPAAGRDEAPDLTPVDLAMPELALPDYDQLPAAHIVGKLAGLTQAERDEIEAHEVAHRRRRTVLGKLDQLRQG